MKAQFASFLLPKALNYTSLLSVALTIIRTIIRTIIGQKMENPRTATSKNTSKRASMNSRIILTRRTWKFYSFHSHIVFKTTSLLATCFLLPTHNLYRSTCLFWLSIHRFFPRLQNYNFLFWLEKTKTYLGGTIMPKNNLTISVRKSTVYKCVTMSSFESCNYRH